MLSRKIIILFTSLIIVNLNIVVAAEWKENAKAIDISGGEDHTLALTANNWPWACGPNGGSGYAGVLGTGSGSSSLTAKTLVQVHDGDMNTPSDYLEDINDIDGGGMSKEVRKIGFLWTW